MKGRIKSSHGRGSFLKRVVESASVRIAELEAENSRLRVALTKLADPENWDQGDDGLVWWPTDYTNDQPFEEASQYAQRVLDEGKS